MTYVAYVNVIEDMPDSIQLWIQIYYFRIIWIHCAAPRSSVQGLQLPPTLRLAVVARFLRSDAAFWKKGRAFAFLLVALAAGRGGKTPSAFTLLPCFAKAFAARQTAAFTKPKGRNMKQTTISKALLYAAAAAAWLTYLKLCSQLHYCLKSILSLTLHIIDKSRGLHKVLVIFIKILQWALLQH